MSNKRVPLMLGGRAFNSQDVAVGEWENVDSGAMAKSQGDYFLWAYVCEGPLYDVRWKVETNDGRTLAEGAMKDPDASGAEWLKAVERAQRVADQYFENNLKGETRWE